ncbi:hypothetical protein FBU30_004863 [Linnemannia zychae]|nr:hypothetical protein FBU30_004863 [Linnemannia zychae]
MAAVKELERLSVPASLGAGFSPSIPSPAPLTSSSIASSALSIHSRNNSYSNNNNRLSVLARSVSGRSSIASSRRSATSIRSHVSTFQNVRFDPDPIKDISFWGGMALLISNMTGPGLVTLPIVAQSAGWLPTILAFGVVSLLSSLSSLFICEAMTEVPGNEYFQSNVEFNNLVECFFGRRYHLLVQIICFLAMQTTNIASIAISAQLFDNLLIQLFHRTCGIQILPHAAFVCVTKQSASASPFSGIMIMTAGVLLALSMILPLALLKLSENIWLQLASFILILLIVMQWIVTFITHGLDTTLVPIIGEDVSQTFGTILFNYAFITTIPSWANAKQPNVSIHKTVGWSVGITTTIYILVAILGGMAYQIPSDSSLIQAISSSPNASVLSKITGYTFPIAALITSIPINIIVIRYNLIQSGACSFMWSNILAGVLPWLIAIPCMTGSGLTTVINWSSLFLVSTANFIIPFILYIYSKRHREKLNKLPIIEMEQQARLSREVSRSSFSGHSRLNLSVSGSIRRRFTGSSLQYGSQNHLDLAIAPTTGIAAASVLPLSVGIGGGVLQHSASEENLNNDMTHKSSRRRYHSHQNTGLGSNSASDAGDLVNGPYFSFSRDGEIFERESSLGHVFEPSDPRFQPTSSIQRPSGSTVILHDPGTERAQKKILPRRVSHKDKILSMISDKHKRAVEKQTKMIQDEQNIKPVPPMILLSQSTAPEPEDDDQSSSINIGLYSQEIEPNEPEKYNEKNHTGETKEISVANNNLSMALRKQNRKSSIIIPQPPSSNRLMLALPPSSPPIMLSPPVVELRSPREWKPTLLDDHKEVDENEQGDESNVQKDTLESELNMAKLDPMLPFKPKPEAAIFSKSGSDTDGLGSEERRSSLGRMAAAFVSQPGAFSILTAPLGLSSNIAKANVDKNINAHAPTLTFMNQSISHPQGPIAASGTARQNVTVPSLSPSGPPGFLSGQIINKRAHGRTVSASAEISNRSPRTQRQTKRTQSTQSLKEIQQQQGRLAAPESSNSLSIHLTPPSPALLQIAQFEAMAPQLEEARDSMTPLASPSGQPSSQPRTPLHHRTSFSNRNNRHSITAPFQSGNNYSFPGFGPYPQVSPQYSPNPASNDTLDLAPSSAHGLGSSWFGRHIHSRNPSRSTMASIGIPHFTGSFPSSPCLMSSDYTSGTQSVGVGRASGMAGMGKHPEGRSREATSGSLTIGPCHTMTTAMIGTMTTNADGATVVDTVRDAEIERAESHIHESNFHLPLYSLEEFNAQWSLRAIPKWFPMSSTSIAWVSLIILTLAIGSTIVYDFIQLAHGKDLVGG